MSKLLIGIGNPGSDFFWTRHNIGALYVQSNIENEQNISSHKKKFSYLKNQFIGQTYVFPYQGDDIGESTIYMNQWGRALVDLKKFVPDHESCEIYIFADELGKPVGWWKSIPFTFSQLPGSHGNKGLRDIFKNFSVFVNHKNVKFFLIRMGIGEPDIGKKDPGRDIAVQRYVLSKFSLEEREVYLPDLFSKIRSNIF